MSHRLAVATVALGSLACIGAAQAAPMELITNGDFEAGDFTAWTEFGIDGGLGFAINDGTFDPPGSRPARAPISGSFDAVSFQIFPGKNNLAQQIVLPNSFDSLVLSWQDRIENFASSFTFSAQRFWVQFVGPEDTGIPLVFSTHPGDPLIQVGPNRRSFDVTSLLTPYAGDPITLFFQPSHQLGHLNVTIDDVSLLADTTVVGVPEPSVLALLGAGVLGLGWLVRRRSIPS